MYASAVPLALAFVGLLWPPGNVETLGEWGLFAWLTLFAILTRGAMTLYHVPHLALGAEMTENYNERNGIVAFRQFFAAIGVAAVSIIELGYFFGEARRAHRGGELRPETLASLDAASAWPKRA